MDDPTDEDTCIICKEKGELKKIGKVAISNLIQTCKRRRSNEHKKWSKLSSALIHNSCSTKYHRESGIAAAAADYSKKAVEGKAIAKEALHFDFKTRCLFCGDVCYPWREEIKHVTKDETRDNILSALKERDKSDKFNKSLLKRIENVVDLTKVQAQYHSSCMAKFYTPRQSHQIGRPPLESTVAFVQHAISYMENLESESQFSLNEIKEAFTSTDIPDLKIIKLQLQKHYNDNIDFTHSKKDMIILLKHKLNPQTWKNWYKDQKKNPEEEKKRIIEMAGELILQDIRATIYDRDNYIIPNFNEENIYENIPESLVNFLTILIKSHKNKKKSSENKWNKRVASIAHVIITSARPRSFLSPILIGLSAMMHKRYASKGLLECLSHIGFSATYEETSRFESSIIADPEIHTFNPESFVQFVYDNADHNTATIDGKGTFHAMGGVKIVTPGSDVISKKTIPRLKKIQSSNTIGKFGFNPVKKYKFDMKKSKLIEIRDIICHHNFQRQTLEMEDFMFLYSKYSNASSKGYGGFMEDFYVGCKYDTSKIFPLPFVNSPPSEYHTIFTVLVEAAAQNKRNKRNDIIFVTFDQPLYLKARFILSCVDEHDDPYGLSKVRVRLGGFHTLMSFIGSIAFIMDGSGLKEAFLVIFAENSAEKALDARAYSRGIRGHFLIQIALTKLIFESIELSDEEKAKLNMVLSDLGSMDFGKEINSDEMTKIRDKFIKEIEKLQKRGPTAALWIQYWDMLCIVRNFLKAERASKWELHLECVKQMIPFFHATGHFNYAKSAHMYVQDMLQLKNDMDRNEYEMFTSGGYFTIRRSDKFWSGVWSDMIIEQFLMRSMKTQGGLTHGRGMGDGVIAKFVLTMIILIEVCNSMETFCDVSYCSSEQHVDSTDARVKRDAADLMKLVEFFARYNPFPHTQQLTSIFSGIVANNSINCHRAYEMGMQSVKSIIGGNFQTVKFTRKSRVLSLKSVQSSITINNETIAINPLLLFQRLCLNINSKSDMRRFLTFELAPFPLALFNENGLRKNVKSQLFDLFTATSACNDNEITHVVDGGYLLRKVVWQKNDSLEEIIEKYLSFVQAHYDGNSCIVFDGYPNSNDADLNQQSTAFSTKTIERLRRQSSSNSPAFELEPHTKITTTQDKFLSNEKNKVELIKRLSEAFRYEGLLIKQAKEDADALIVNTAIEIAEKYKIVNAATGEVEYSKNVIIVGQDIDLLVLLHQLNSNDAPVYFLKCGTGNVEDSMYSSNCFKYEKFRFVIAFIHCFTGCDTISSFAGKGKKTTVESLIKTENLDDLVKPFYDQSADPQVIARNGCKLIESIYNCSKKISSLNDLRFNRYQVLTEKCTFSLEKLPPTIGAAIQHAYRSYHQLQMWLGNELNASKWGWREIINNDSKILMPHYTELSLIPDDLLKKVSCKCQSNCRSNKCGCRKLGLKCTVLCRNCDDSDHCSNKEIIIENESDSEELEQPNLLLNNENNIEQFIENEDNYTEHGSDNEEGYIEHVSDDEENAEIEDMEIEKDDECHENVEREDQGTVSKKARLK